MEENSYEMPPLNAWDSPPATLNGFPSSSGVSPRRLEPLALPRMPGTMLGVKLGHPGRCQSFPKTQSILLNEPDWGCTPGEGVFSMPGD